MAILEFSDFECPFCQRHALGVRREIVEQFVQTGLVRYAFVHHPLPSHSNAIRMATAAICAGLQNDFWRMHERLFEAPSRGQTVAALLALALEIGLDETKFADCMENDVHAGARIDADIETAKALGLPATPSFALGRIDGDGVVHVDTLITGAQPMTIFRAEIERILENSE